MALAGNALPPRHWQALDIRAPAQGARPIAVGRSTRLDIVVPGQSVSRLHVLLVWASPTHCLALDNQSTNGTWFWRDGAWARVQRPGVSLAWGEFLHLGCSDDDGAMLRVWPPLALQAPGNTFTSGGA